MQHDQTNYQLVVIGAGPGGYVAAIKAAQLGLRTAVVEQAEVGGTCLNRGCIPTKTLVHTAELYEETERAEIFGLTVEGVSLDFDVLRARKEQVCTTLREGVEKLLENNGVDLIRGRATVLSRDKVAVELLSPEEDAEGAGAGVDAKDTGAGAEGTGAGDNSAAPGSLVLETENIIIAAGTLTEMPQIEGIDLPGVHNSDTLLRDVPDLKSLVVVGGGIIGMEFANIYATYGADVTVLITSNRPLRALDKELGQSLSMEMKKKGATIITQASVQRIEQGDDLRIIYTAKEKECVVEAEAVLMAKGRYADVDSLLAEGLTLECNRGKIVVDEKMRTSVEGIYAIGDICTAAPELAHAASAEGIIAASTIAGEHCTRRLDLIPSCVYTSPEIACVGMTEAEAKEAGIETKVGKFPLANNGKTLITEQGRSFIKIIADEDDRVIGAQLLCARATDIVGEITLGIAAGLTVEEMLEIARPHPTFEEAVGEALENVVGTAIHSITLRKKP